MPTGTASDGADREVVFARFFRVFSDPTRLAIISLLLDRPHTVSELVEKTGAHRSRVSNHLACLRWCRFVSDERRGRSVVYTVIDERVAELFSLAERLTENTAEHLASCYRIGPS